MRNRRDGAGFLELGGPFFFFGGGVTPGGVQGQSSKWGVWASEAEETLHIVHIGKVF